MCAFALLLSNMLLLSSPTPIDRWTRRHEFVHEGAEQRRREGEAARDRLVAATARTARERAEKKDSAWRLALKHVSVETAW